MSPEDFVDQLYRAVLDRPADAQGLADWSAHLRRTGDPTAVLAGLIGSEEHAARSAPAASVSGLVETTLQALGRRPRVVDVGAQALETEDHVYAPLLDLAPVDIVGFDPLADRLEQRELAEGRRGGELTLLPYALGDGRVHTLHVNNDDATSSLFPLNEALTSRLNHLATLHTVRTVEVETRRLDDVLPEGPVDLLKLDVQGAELMVLQHAGSTLARTAVVHCEVEFAPIYDGQPLFGDVAAVLARNGFSFVDLNFEARYHHLGASVPGPDRLVWGDAGFLNDVEEPEMLMAQALVMATVYGKWSVAEDLLRRAGGSTVPPGSSLGP
jgi:FkbM family methyltransferase